MPVSLNRSRRLVVLAVCSTSLLLVGLDTTIVNIALPTIHRSLHSSLAGLQWTIDAYTLVLASLLMLAGSTADRFGRKRVFQSGLILFTLGSTLCAAAPTLDALIGARVLQAIGASMLGPVALSIVRNVFEDPRELAQAIGVWAAVFGISVALGPVLGGALVAGGNWRWVFLINVPIALSALGLTARYVPESKADRPRALDPIGQALVILSLATLTGAIIQAPTLGLTSAPILTLALACALSTCALIGYERSRAEPLLDVRLFRSIPFSAASTTAIAAFAALAGLLFQNTLYLQDVRHLGPLHAGLCTLPLAAMILIFAPLSGRILARRGARLPLLLAGAPMAIAPLLLLSVTPSTPLWLLIGAYTVFGIGFGFVNPPITHTAISGLPPAQAGVAGAIASTSRQVGATLGVAIIGAVLNSSATLTGPRFTEDARTGLWILATLGTLIMVLATRSSRATQPHKTAPTRRPFTPATHTPPSRHRTSPCAPRSCRRPPAGHSLGNTPAAPHTGHQPRPNPGTPAAPDAARDGTHP